MPSLNPKKLFFLDAIGAFLTAFMLGIVLSGFEHFFGMPKSVLQPLATTAVAFGLYSIFCHFLLSDNWRPFLKVIFAANILYCCVTIVLVIFWFRQLTIWGITYFAIESSAMTAVIFLERKMIFK